ncbi:Lipase-3 domain-containing protein [Mycena sanguinolenta]|uniref:Lipase-3 domain-containing protein n=1 Tax=Mycena sanguinolenta TaxID=230812 RepID=A0A8H7CIM8_9AGAR|nr:Lipase-3 domain-containing protein [Mycena sanguinolenta]
MLSLIPFFFLLPRCVFAPDLRPCTFLRPAQFARVAYCSSASITAWTCGTPCEALKNITFLQSGGNQGTIPLYYIAHDADGEALVVAHEGTDAKNILSILNDAEFGLVPLNASRFPETAGQNITVHSGFQETFERTADGLLAGVMSGLASTGVKKVLVTGHSLGAALATMTGAMIKDAVDPSVEVSVVGFGLPRGGNPAWADFLDNGVGVTFMTNQNDPVPVVPPKFLGFQHSSGEVHIVDDTQQNFVACPGQDNENCSTGNNVLDSSVQNHLGPYFDDITFGGSQCSS